MAATFAAASPAALFADDRPLVLVTTVDIGEGRSGSIELREGDDPRAVALRFCAAHGLPDAVADPLLHHMLENLERAHSQDAEAAELEEAYDDYQQEDDGPAEQEPWGNPLYGASGASSPAVSEAVTALPVAPPLPRAASARPPPPAMGARPGTAAARQPLLGMGPPPPKKRGPSLLHEAAAAAEEVTAALAAPPPPAHVPAPAPAPAAQLAQPPPQPQPLAHPASATSSYGTEYHGRPEPSAAPPRSGAAATAPVADRLYADHFRKQRLLEEQRRIRDLELALQTEQVHCTPVSRALAAHRTAGGYASYGERLYAEGRLDSMRRDAAAAAARVDEEAAELEGATFHPQISRLAQALKAAAAARGAASGGGATPWERLHAHGGAVRREMRAEGIRREQEEEERRECSFRPAVDANSDRLTRQRRAAAAGGGLPLHQRLYCDAQRRRGRLAAAAARPLEGATFAPRVNPALRSSATSLQELLRGAGGSDAGSEAGPRRGGGGADVENRLLSRGRRYEARLDAARQEQAAPVDRATGRPLFQPETLRAPRTQRNPGGAPIGEHLYAAGAAAEARAARQQAAAAAAARAEAAAPHVNAASHRMVGRLKRERLAAVYCYLGRGEPGEGPPPGINLLRVVRDAAFMDTIDPEVRADVEHAARLLERTLSRGAGEDAPAGEEDGGAARPASEREAAWAGCAGGEVGADAFVALMEEALARTRGISRQYLLPMPAARRKWDDPTFHPELDTHSLRLAARSRPAHVPGHDILYSDAAQAAARREARRRELAAAALRECSFRPALVAAPMAREGRALKMASAGRQAGGGQAPPAERRTPARARTSGPPPKRDPFVWAPPSPRQQEQEQQQQPHPQFQEQRRPAARPRMAAPPAASPPAPAAAAALRASRQGGAGGESLEEGIDAIERQIKDAMSRLSFTGEQFVSSLRADPARQQGGAGAGGRHHDASLDYSALFGGAAPAESAAAATPHADATHHSVLSSLRGFNPLDDAAGEATPVAALRGAGGGAAAGSGLSLEALALAAGPASAGAAGSTSGW